VIDTNRISMPKSGDRLRIKFRQCPEETVKAAGHPAELIRRAARASSLHIGDFGVYEGNFHILIYVNLLLSQIHDLVWIAQCFLHSSGLISNLTVLLPTADAVAGSVITASMDFLTSSGVISSSPGNFTFSSARYRIP
jgi:hypothetical protein